MLQIIRDRSQGVFAWIIVGLISVPFALWGINSYFGGGGDISIAEVDGVEISPRQLTNAYQQQRDRLKQMFGGKIPENIFSEATMKSQILQQLIEKEVLIKAAADNRMRIGDNQLANTVRGIDAFYADGKFNQQQYERVLAQQGMSPRLFEQRVRRDLISAQLKDAVSSTEFTLDSELDSYLRLQQQQRDIGYMVLSVDSFMAGVEVSEEEARTYYEANSSSYMQQEMVKIDYLELKADELSSSIEVTDEEMRLRYDTQKLNFRTPEERKASHILIQAGNSASDDEKNSAQAKAEELLQRINSGENFATLAKTESQDPGSAKKGGDLGFFGMDVMDKAFETAAFALKKGEVSSVVRSSFGFHIIKLDDIKGGETKSYEQVAVELKTEIQNERAADIFFDKSEQLANYTYEQPDTLSVAAEQLQLEIKSSDYFTRSGGTGIASNPKVSAAAFAEDVLTRGNNSESIEIGDNHFIVLRIKDHKLEALRPFDEVKVAIESSIKTEKAKAKTLAQADELFAKLQSGETPESLATSHQLEWKKQNGMMRDDKEMDRTIVQATFRMSRPKEGQFSSEKLALPSGDQALLALYAIKDGDTASAEAKTRSDAKQRMERASSNAVEQSLIAGLRQRAEITIQQ